MNNVGIRQNRDNDFLLQEMKDYLFGGKNKKELNCYTVLGFKDKDDFVREYNNFNDNVKNYLLSSRQKKARRELKKIQLKVELEDIQNKKERKILKDDIKKNALHTNKIVDSNIYKKGLQYIIDLENKIASCNELEKAGSNTEVIVLQRNNNKLLNESHRDNALNYLSSLEKYLNTELFAVNLNSLLQSEKDKLEEKFQRFNKENQLDDKITSISIKEGGLSGAIRLKEQILSYQQEFKKEKQTEKEKNCNNRNKVDENHSKILGKYSKGIMLWYKFNLDYIKQVKNDLGFNPEYPLEKTIEKCFLVKNKDKSERKLKKKFEKRIRKFNKEHPFYLKFIDDNIQKNGLAFITELKQRAIFNIKKQDKSSLLYQHYCIFNYIESMEKSLSSSVDSFSLLSQIWEDSIKILSNSSLRLAYDEGVAKKELSPLASYEECIKYQQRVNERDSSVEKSESVIEGVNNQQQIKETLKNDKKAEKAPVVKRVDISYLPSTSTKILKPKKMSPTIQPLKKVQVVQNLDSNTMSNLYIVQKLKRLLFSNTITLLLSVHERHISSMFGMKNFQTSVVTRVNWPGLSISMGVKNIKALEDSQEKLTNIETPQNIQKDNNKGKSSNSFLNGIHGILSNVKNWCYNIVGLVVNFTGVILKNDTLNSNLNISYKSEIEPGILGQYTKISSDTINKASIDNKQTVNSQLCNVTIVHKL